MNGKSTLTGFNFADELKRLINQQGKIAHGQASLKSSGFEVLKQGLIFGVMDGFDHCPHYEDMIWCPRIGDWRGNINCL